MKCHYSCKTDEHTIHRRKFLGGLAAGMGVVGGLDFFAHPATAKKLAKTEKKVVVINMAGGLSQLESWDPKPKTRTGGPFRAIPTSVPGIHLSELLPEIAKQMKHLTVVRSLNTHTNDHGKGSYMMFYGRKQTPAEKFPQIGAVMAKALGDQKDTSLPGHIKVSSGGSGNRNNDAEYLGPKYASITLGSGKAPKNTKLPKGLTATLEDQRQAFRRRANDRFALRRRTAQTDAYTYNYEQALELMRQRSVFDISKESKKDQDRYGGSQFGRHCLLARRLLENGISFVQLSHSNYDTHNENFNFHLEQMGEFDGPFANLVADIADRGMLDSTLFVVLSEFGRTPNINRYYGRDHWGRSWSICMGGGKLPRGAAYGKTNKEGTAVTDKQLDHGPLFHTYLEALGIDSTSTFDIGGRPIPMADPAYQYVSDLIV